MKIVKQLLSIALLTFFTMPLFASDGHAIYQKTCQMCHTIGVAGAPKLGDKAAWKDRISKGVDQLSQNAIKGFKGKMGVMPPKGGATDLSDDDVKAAVKYMVDQAK